MSKKQKIKIGGFYDVKSKGLLISVRDFTMYLEVLKDDITKEQKIVIDHIISGLEEFNEKYNKNFTNN